MTSNDSPAQKDCYAGKVTRRVPCPGIRRPFTLRHLCAVICKTLLMINKGKGATVSACEFELPKLKRYLRVAQVRERYGNASDEWIRRKTREAAFPCPYYIDGADRFWSAEELDAWDAATLKREPQRPRKAVRP
ncbi:putative DNA-binding transcriptional regulator AlpA [Bradyrhizobium sp. LB1.3]